MKKYYFVLMAVLVLLAGCGETKKDTASSENTGKEKKLHKELDNDEKELITVHTGIEAKRIWISDAYSYIQALDEYLDRKQFALMKITFVGENRLFKGAEGQEWSGEDWDIVRPLGKPTAYDCGYGKIDYNNDGVKEILYRNISESLEITGYEIDLETKQVTNPCNLLEVYQNKITDKGCLQQMWFEEIEGETITFSLFQEPEDNSFMIYSGRFEMNGDSLDFSLIEARSLNVITEEVETSDEAWRLDIFTGIDESISDGTDGAYRITDSDINLYRENRMVESLAQETDLPQELLEAIEKALIAEQGNKYSAAEVLEEYEDKEHSIAAKEALKIWGDTARDYAGEELIRCAYLADLNKDGKNELIMSVDSGGSAGFADVEIWHEDENGAVVKMDSFPEVRGYEALLLFDGNYYFVVKDFNYNTGETEGFRVIFFADNGTVEVHEIMLENKSNQKEWYEMYANENLSEETRQQLKEYVDGMKTEVENKTVGNGDYQLIYGGAEVPYAEGGEDFSIEVFSEYQEEYMLVDFDNDGARECVRKNIWFPSSLNSVMCLNTKYLKKYDSYVREVQIPFPENAWGKSYKRESSILMQLWFEEFDGKIYTFDLKRVGSTSDYIMEISLIENKKIIPVYQYLLIAEKKFSYQ